MKGQIEEGNIRERWNAAKQRIFSAYAEKPTSQIFIWRSLPGEIWEKTDVEIIEELADYAEFCASTLIAKEHDLNIELYKDDDYLLKIFSLNRQFREQNRIIQSQCRYCGTKVGPIYKWTTSSKKAIDEDVSSVIYVCPSNDQCAQMAHSSGYTISRLDRWRKVYSLVDQRKTQREMAEILHVSVSTIRKDIRNLRRETNEICPNCGDNVKARFSDIFQYAGEVKCKFCENKVYVSFYD